MARDYATIQTKIRDTPDWTNLTTGAQSLYIPCLTHSTLTIAGVLDWRPNRLATLAADLTTETVNTLGNELEAAGFLIIDHDAEYAFIRSFHRHDGTMKQRNLGTSAARLITNIDSPYIKDHIAHELWRIHADHPDWAGFKSEELREFMDRRANMTPDTTPPTTPTTTPGLTPPTTLNERVNRGGANEGTDDPIHDPGIQGAGESLKPLNPETLKPKDKTHAHSAGAECAAADDEPTAPKRKAYPDAFERFWSAYPKRVAKKRAHEKWAAAVRAGANPETITAGAAGYARLCAVEDRPDSKIKYPEGWLSAGRYDDDYPALIAAAEAQPRLQTGTPGTGHIFGTSPEDWLYQDNTPTHATAQIIDLKELGS